MALDLTIKQLSDDNVEIYINDKLLFARIHKVLPARAKGKFQWTFTLEHLPVETYALYKDVPDALIAIENYINLLNRNSII